MARLRVPPQEYPRLRGSRIAIREEAPASEDRHASLAEAAILAVAQASRAASCTDTPRRPPRATSAHVNSVGREQISANRATRVDLRTDLFGPTGHR
ncbi:hypothetical protein Athai_46350 [Actinocatenispora thailandica]|uniref:Uncharacterized protein n=1 Tax=Actinocatenispora thailandica TaxID=227318 RepID=A0A7R7HYB1_9ACTN|nr:hypothetical protein Athai_46350 [Actinocatenispora thailandica]